MKARTICRAARGLTLCAAALALSPALAAATPSPQDRAATHAYLLAIYGYEQQTVANLPSSVASAQGAGASLGGECPGVLAGVPNSSQLEGPEGQPPRTGPGSARERGEENRRGRQLNGLQGELAFSLDFAFSQPDRAAALTLMSALGSLSWSDSRLTQLARQAADGRVQTLSTPSPAVCADLRAWAVSGYRTLSPGTKQFLSALRAGEELEDCRRAGVTVLTIFDEHYPPRLRALHDPPPVLFVRGCVDVLHQQHSAAVVGTRVPTRFGCSATEKITAALADGGWSVVSGLAKASTPSPVSEPA